MEKTTNLLQVTDKLLSHNVVLSTPCNEWTGLEITNLVAIVVNPTTIWSWPQHPLFQSGRCQRVQHVQIWRQFFIFIFYLTYFLPTSRAVFGKSSCFNDDLCFLCQCNDWLIVFCKVTNILCIFRTRTKSTISKIYIEIQERWDNMSGLYNSYQLPLAPG